MYILQRPLSKELGDTHPPGILVQLLVIQYEFGSEIERYYVSRQACRFND